MNATGQTRAQPLFGWRTRALDVVSFVKNTVATNNETVTIRIIPRDIRVFLR
jgi:hypothetical protein